MPERFVWVSPSRRWNDVVGYLQRNSTFYIIPSPGLSLETVHPEQWKPQTMRQVKSMHILSKTPTVGSQLGCIRRGRLYSVVDLICAEDRQGDCPLGPILST
jgi:hypothetical protein